MSGDLMQTLLDRAAVQDVLARGAQAQDARDWEGLATCFEPDATYVHPSGQLEGAAAIVDRSRGALTSLDASQHLVGSILVTVEGDEAHATSYFQAQHIRADAAGGPLYVIAGTYRDRLTRRSGQWRIAERVQTYTWRDGNPAVIGRGPSGSAP